MKCPCKVFAAKKKQEGEATPPSPLRACDMYTWCALECSHDPNLDSSTNRRANTMNEAYYDAIAWFE